jgi:rhomboid family GlyGly-CTERM serine protease
MEAVINIPRERREQGAGIWYELAAISLLLIVVNLPLFSGGVAEGLIFDASIVAQGEWWRVLSYPFVHLSWYHFTLDAGAFLLLWKSLDTFRAAKRIGYALAGIGGGLLWSLLAPATVGAIGLCGLSGAAHGLMMALGLEMLTDAKSEQGERLMGAVSMALLSAKVAWEAISGRALLGALHFGDIGTPVVASHVGGVLGCLILAAALWLARRVKSR